MTSFIDASGVERLFLSPAAVFDGKAAIRGGIPVRGGLLCRVWATIDRGSSLCFPSSGQMGLCQAMDSRGPRHGALRRHLMEAPRLCSSRRTPLARSGTMLFVWSSK
jgi:hypothetical protein